MKKLLLLLIIPFLSFSQSADTLNIFSVHGGGGVSQICFSYNTIFSDSIIQIEEEKAKHNIYEGVFFSLKFEIGKVSGKDGKNFSNNLGAIIAYIANSENAKNSFHGLHNGRYVSFFTGGHIRIMKNVFKHFYLSPAIGLTYFQERAQYSDLDFGGDFYFRTNHRYDLSYSLGLSSLIKNKWFLQLGWDMLPDNQNIDYLNYDIPDSFKLSNKKGALTFGVGYVL